MHNGKSIQERRALCPRPVNVTGAASGGASERFGLFAKRAQNLESIKNWGCRVGSGLG